MKALLCEKATTFRRIILEIVENPHSLYQESVSYFEKSIWGFIKQSLGSIGVVLKYLMHANEMVLLEILDIDYIAILIN